MLWKNVRCFYDVPRPELAEHRNTFVGACDGGRSVLCSAAVYLRSCECLGPLRRTLPCCGADLIALRDIEMRI